MKNFEPNQYVFKKEIESVAINVRKITEKKTFATCDDNQLLNFYKNFQENIKNDKIEKISYNDITEVLAIIKEVVYRKTKLKAFDTQIQAAFALYHGVIIDMKTGEGKTLAGLIATCLFGLSPEKKCYVVSTNDYLSKRDYTFSKPVLDFFCISNIYVNNSFKKNSSQETILKKRKKMYSNQVLYITNNTLLNNFCINLLSDNSKDIFMPSPTLNKKNNKYEFKNCAAIIDEIDSILIDDGINLFTYSSPVKNDKAILIKAYEIAKTLVKDDYSKDEESGGYHLTLSGIERVCDSLKIDREKYFTTENKLLRKSILKSLEAIHSYKNNYHYIVKDDKVVILNHETGRLNENMRFTNGLHQLLEVKENVTINDDTTSICGITYPSFYKKFEVFSGMSGTILTEAKEIEGLYDKYVYAISPNKKSNRIDHEDIICQSKLDKESKIVNQIELCHKNGQPVLCIVKNIDDGEHYLNLLNEKKLSANLLSAKNNKEEAAILEKCGKLKQITIATIMAGRGVDIVTSEETEKAGGLFIIGCERFYARRIDNQLCGRTGRQGSSGQTQFYLSLDDEIASLYAEKISSLSSLESKIKSISGFNLSREDYGTKQIKKIYFNAQKEKEYKDYEQRCLYMELFSALSDEFILLFSQKNELLKMENEELENLIKTNFPKRIDDASNPDIKIIIKDSIYSEWCDFFERDRYEQQLQLRTTLLNENFIDKYKAKNAKNWHALLEKIKK